MTVAELLDTQLDGAEFQHSVPLLVVDKDSCRHFWEPGKLEIIMAGECP